MDDRELAIERLYRERYLNFRNTMATVTGNKELAKDAVQEGFARALRKRHQFRGEGSLEAWVWRIVLRAGFEVRRNGSEQAFVEGMEVEPRLAAPERDPELAAALRRLAPRRRLVVFLRYFADLSYAEISEVCAISEGTVAATLARAHEVLVDELRGAETYDH